MKTQVSPKPRGGETVVYMSEYREQWSMRRYHESMMDALRMLASGASFTQVWIRHGEVVATAARARYWEQGGCDEIDREGLHAWLKNEEEEHWSIEEEWEE